MPETKPAPSAAGKKQDTPKKKPAPNTSAKPERKEETLRISAMPREGFCRAGRRWPHSPTEVNTSEFTEEQLAQLKAERMLKVEVVSE